MTELTQKRIIARLRYMDRFKQPNVTIIWCATNFPNEDAEGIDDITDIIFHFYATESEHDFSQFTKPIIKKIFVDTVKQMNDPNASDSIMKNESKLNLFQSLLQEAIDNKPFNTVGELKDAIKSVLNSHARLSMSDTSDEYHKFGFKFKTYKREFRLKIFGDDSHSLLGSMKKAGIHCKYSTMNDTIVIRYEDNVAVSGLLSDEVQEEIETGTYGLIGYITIDKENPEFFDKQQKLYNELNKYGMIEWKNIDRSFTPKYKLQLKEI